MPTYRFGEERGLVVSLTESGTGTQADPSRAQALARVGHPAGTIQSESSVSASVAQANARRQDTR